MSFPCNATLEERERYAYITGSPVHPLLSWAVDHTEDRVEDAYEDSAKLEAKLKEVEKLCAVMR